MDPICFAYNLAGCAHAQAGGWCGRGLHVCAEPKCEQAHPINACKQEGQRVRVNAAPQEPQQFSLEMSFNRVCADMGAQRCGACVEEHDKQGRNVDPSLASRVPRPQLGCALVDEWANLPATSIPGDVGFIAVAVDSVENILMQRDCFFRFDLNDPVVQWMPLRFCTDPDLLFVHVAPPCGTASRARETPLPRALAQIGVHEPPSARSEAHPAGLPGLASVQLKLAARVSAERDFGCPCFLRSSPPLLQIRRNINQRKARFTEAATRRNVSASDNCHLFPLQT